MSGIFVAATRQHVGKSTTSLGLLGALRNRVPHETISFMKPVGQQHETVDGIRIDKDCRLAKEYFDLQCPYTNMSPVLMPRGYTKSFIDGEVALEQQEAKVVEAWTALKAGYPNAIVEGTGHMGVGSIVGLDNARVAKLLGLDVVLVCEGGLGSAFDELSMNLALCERQGVNVRSVIVNRAKPDKVTMLRDYFGRALAPSGVPLAGIVPLEPFLSSASMMDYAKLFAAPFISGEEHLLRHCDGLQLVTSSTERFKERLGAGEYQRKLLVIHGSRLDVIEGVLDHHRATIRGVSQGFQGAMIFTGTNRSWAPSREILSKLQASEVPTLHAPLETTDAIARMQKFTAKLNARDRQRTEAAIQHVQSHVDLDLVLGGRAA